MSEVRTSPKHTSSGTVGCAPNLSHGANVVARLAEILNDLTACALQLRGD